MCGSGNGSGPCGAAGGWSTGEYLWLPFVAGGTAAGGGAARPPAEGPCQLSEQVARLVRLPEYSSLSLGGLPEGHATLARAAGRRATRTLPV